jgi:hypothetical protein
MEALRRNSNMLPLLTRLSKEPVMLEFELVGRPITKLADGIDSADQKVETITDDELRKERLKASIDRCREAFALLLLEIPPEQMPVIQKQSVLELIAVTPATAPPAPQAEPEKPEEQMQFLPQTPVAPAMPPPPLKRPPPPVVAAARPVPGVAAAAPVPAPAVPAPVAVPIPVPAAAAVPETALVPEAVEATPTNTETSLVSTATLPPPTVAVAAPPPDSEREPALASTDTLTPLAAEMIQFADLLQKQQGHLPQTHLNRLILQHHIMALECECQEKLRPGLKQVWPQRKQALLPYLDPQTQAVSSAVKTFLKQLETNHPEWIGPFEFSVGWLQVMLRYWLSDSGQGSFHPSLAECGFVLCLFGHPGHDGLPSNNLLGLSGLETPKIEELVARLNRLHRYRNQIFNVREPLSEPAQKQVQEDLQTCFGLVKQLRCEVGEGA